MKSNVIRWVPKQIRYTMYFQDGEKIEKSQAIEKITMIRYIKQVNPCSYAFNYKLTGKGDTNLVHFAKCSISYLVDELPNFIRVNPFDDI